jgi:hypothetical protein
MGPAEGPNGTRRSSGRGRRYLVDNRTVPIEVRISEPRLLDELMAALLRNRCVTHQLRRDSCAVVHVDASDTDEALRELEFFVGAWQLAHPGVSAHVSA